MNFKEAAITIEWIVSHHNGLRLAVGVEKYRKKIAIN